MPLPATLNKPEYLFRPRQIARRVMGRSERSGAFTQTMLPWGVGLRSRPADLIGASISRMGVYDLCVTEALWRLLDPGELAVDVGANIGYMTSLMARRVGLAGRVIAFEPHPEIYKELRFNVELFRSSSQIGRICPFRSALSAAAGTGRLLERVEFPHNRGGASLVDEGDTTRGHSFSVETLRLDDVIGPRERIGVMKIDVEGHELDVLKGSERLLRNHQIRDIVFEEHSAIPTPVTRKLESRGYRIFRLAKGLLGPLLFPPTKHIATPFDTANYLGTVDAERALGRLRPRFWQVLRG